jgi:hypothetical protein
MKTKMFATNQSLKEQKLKFWLPLEKNQDFPENPHDVQKLSFLAIRPILFLNDQQYYPIRY